MTCNMIVLSYILLTCKLGRETDAPQKLWQHAMPDRTKPGAGWRMVEHSHSARRLSWAEAVRRVSGEPRHRAQHAGAAPQSAGRGGAPRTAPLQRAAAAR